MNKYKAYLYSEQWQQIRKKVLKRDKNRCKVCKATKHLHVHHKTYKRLYKERLSDLVTLCKDCHRKEHRRYTKMERFLMALKIVILSCFLGYMFVLAIMEYV